MLDDPDEDDMPGFDLDADEPTAGTPYAFEAPDLAVRLVVRPSAPLEPMLRELFSAWPDDDTPAPMVTLLCRAGYADLTAGVLRSVVPGDVLEIDGPALQPVGHGS